MRVRDGRSWPEPVGAEVKEAPVGPAARGAEEDKEEDGAVDAGPIEEVGADEEQEYKGGGGVCRYEEEGEPAAGTSLAVRPRHRHIPRLSFQSVAVGVGAA